VSQKKNRKKGKGPQKTDKLTNYPVIIEEA